MQSSKQYKDTRYEGVDYLLKTLDKAGISIEFDEKQCSSNEEGIYLLDERKIIFRDDKPSVHVLKLLSWNALQHCKMWKYDDTKSRTFYPWKKEFEDFINASGIDANKLTETYKESGLDPSRIILSLEAEAAATYYLPEQIADFFNQCLKENKLSNEVDIDKKAKRLKLFPLEFISDCINWIGEALWRGYLFLTRGYWGRTGLTTKGSSFNEWFSYTRKRSEKAIILDILSFPFMVALYFGYLVLAFIFYAYVFIYPFQQFALVFANMTSGVSGVIAIVGMVAWINYVLRRPKRWPLLPWKN